MPWRDGVLVLADGQGPDDGSRVRNLVLLSATGDEAWTAELPDAAIAVADAYTWVGVEEGEIRAFSASCHAVVLDPATGRVRDQVFTK